MQKPFLPRLAHPENFEFCLSKNLTSGYKYRKFWAVWQGGFRFFCDFMHFFWGNGVFLGNFEGVG
jgi:hypothetical protein